jgi:hypothetical protein
MGRGRAEPLFLYSQREKKGQVEVRVTDVHQNTHISTFYLPERGIRAKTLLESKRARRIAVCVAPSWE